MNGIKIDIKNSKIMESELQEIKDRVLSAQKELATRTGLGNDFLGWLDLPTEYDKEENERIKKVAEKINKDSDILVVIGIGGSYLGACAGIEFLQKRKPKTKVLFAGNTLSGDYIESVLEELEGKDWSINVISKSGTTLEPAVSFRIFRRELEKKYGREEASRRIYATTDKSRGALKSMADENGYETFVIPDDVGGRYSVLTAVGMLPFAVCGADTDMILKGATDERDECQNVPFENISALKYAAIRNIMLEKGKNIEALCCYEPSMRKLSEWWMQLFGESEGKDRKGLYPSALCYTTDLHSMGQYVQDGQRTLFETVVYAENSLTDMVINKEDDNRDGLNYLEGKTLDFANKCAMEGTAEAHLQGDAPSIFISFDKKSEYALGRLIYFFEYSCAVSGYMLGINPFNQPGVEDYKREMFRRLGRDKA